MNYPNERQHWVTGPNFSANRSFSLDWHFIAEDERGCTILSKLTKIMGLRASESNDYPKIIFSASPPSKICFNKINSAYSVGRQHIPKDHWDNISFPFLTFWWHPESSDVVCQVLSKEDYLKDIMTTMMSTYPLTSKLLEFGGLPFHAGLIEKKGEAILLAGSGGAGKSTCCKRIPLPWRSPSDDEAMIVPNNSHYRVHSFPTWSELTCDSEKPENCQVGKSYSLRAICFLEQNKSDELIGIGKGEATALVTDAALQMFSRHLAHMSSRAGSFASRIFENALQVADTIPIYRMKVSRAGPFWDELEELLQ